MAKVTVLTTQNVPIQYEVASIGARMGAYAIDFIIVVAYAIATLVILTEFVSLDVALLVITMLPVVFYHLVCEVFFEGQSIGKRLLKLRVVRLDGAQPTLGNYVMRWLFRLIESAVFFAGVIPLITMLVNGRGQRVGDLAAGTTVVKLDAPVALEDTIFRLVEEDYQPVYPQVMKLSDEDLQTIGDVLELSRQRNDPMLLSQLARQVRTVLALDGLDLPTAASQFEFLQTVVKDYNYLAIRQ